MPEALIIRAPVAFTDPLPGTPVLPDLSSGLYIDLDAATLSGADGSSVSSWVGDGSGSTLDRTFSKNAQGGGWGFPTLDIDGGPNGGKAVAFNGGQKIANTDSNSGADLTAITQPTTLAIVARGAGGTTARFVGGTSGNLQNIVPTASGTTITVAAGGTAGVTHDTNAWSIIIVAFDGSNSRVKAGAAPIAAINPGTNGYRGFAIGGNASANGSTGLVGAVARLKFYNRKLTDGEIQVLYETLAAEYGL